MWYNKGMNVEKMLCPAMSRAGITEAESKEGIVFCTEQCPYPAGCVLFEDLKGTAHNRLLARQAWVKHLYGHGLATEDIALIMQVSMRTIMRYLAA